MKLAAWITQFEAACQAHGIPGDSREGKARHNFRLRGKRMISFEFRPYRWVFFRVARADFLAQADPEQVTKAPSAHEPGPHPCAVFTGTQPADDEALKALILRFVAAVAEGRLVPIKTDKRQGDSPMDDGAAVEKG